MVHPPHKIRLPFPPLHDTAATLREFWPTQSSLINSIDNVSSPPFLSSLPCLKAALRDAHRHQELPLARIKKIMKLDDDVKNQVLFLLFPYPICLSADISPCLSLSDDQQRGASSLGESV